MEKRISPKPPTEDTAAKKAAGVQKTTAKKAKRAKRTKRAKKYGANPSLSRRARPPAGPFRVPGVARRRRCVRG